MLSNVVGALTSHAGKDFAVIGSALSDSDCSLSSDMPPISPMGDDTLFAWSAGPREGNGEQPEWGASSPKRRLAYAAVDTLISG